MPMPGTGNYVVPSSPPYLKHKHRRAISMKKVKMHLLYKKKGEQIYSWSTESYFGFVAYTATIKAGERCWKATIRRVSRADYSSDSGMGLVIKPTLKAAKAESISRIENQYS